MNFKKLGNTDIDVSTICLGTMTWGEQNSEKDAFEQMDYAFEQNVNFWDTAEIYAIPPKESTYGKTEEIIGNWFMKTKKRSRIVLATKVSGPGPGWIRGGGNQYDEKNLNEAVDNSLKRLKTDYIDLYQLHWPERKTNFFGRLGYEHKDDNDWNKFEDILNSLDKIIKSGKIRYIGLSNETAWGLSKFLEISKLKKLPRMMSIQNPYSLLNRIYEVGLAEISYREKVGLLAYSPLGFGMLTGKYQDKPPKGSRLELFGDWFTRYSNEKCIEATNKYIKLAKQYEMSVTHMSLAFVNTRPFVTSNIIGATTINQLEENINSIDIELPETLIEEIEKVHEEIPNPAP